MNRAFKKIVILGVVIGFGVTLSFYFYQIFRYQEKKVLEQRFFQQTDMFLYAMKERFLRNQEIIRGCVSLIESSQYLSPEEWSLYVSQLNFQKNFPGIQWVSTVKEISQSQKNSFEEEMRATYRPTYKVWPQIEKSVFYPIVYINPKLYQELIGYDLSNMQNIADALFKARNEKELVCSKGEGVSPTDINKSRFFIIYPVLSTQAAPKTFYGWVVASLDFSLIINQLAASLQIFEMNIQVFSGKESDRSNLIFETGSYADPEPIFYKKETTDFFGSSWTFVFTSSSVYKEQLSQGDAIIFLIGMLVIVGIVSYVIYRFYFVQQEITAFHQENSCLSPRCLALLDSINFGIIMTDIKGMICIFNKKAEKLLGYRADEVVGKSTTEIFHDPQEVVKRADELSVVLQKEIHSGFEVFIALAEQGVPDEREWTYVRKDGVKIRVLLSITIVKNVLGEPLGFVGVVREIQQK